MADAHKTSVAGSLSTTFSEKLKITSAKIGGDQKARRSEGYPGSRLLALRVLTHPLRPQQHPPAHSLLCVPCPCLLCVACCVQELNVAIIKATTSQFHVVPKEKHVRSEWGSTQPVSLTRVPSLGSRPESGQAARCCTVNLLLLGGCSLPQLPHRTALLLPHARALASNP